MFQFPTGWNSTFCIWSWKCRFRCFNSQRDGILQNSEEKTSVDTKFQFPTGWNSTLLLKIFIFLFCVSIPNGMEFYPTRLATAAAYLCFNSQRDGILLFPGGAEYLARLSFNSQRDGILREFKAFDGLIGDCFNSQRDGILRCLNRQNFYPKCRFNSQRDGILLSCQI